MTTRISSGNGHSTSSHIPENPNVPRTSQADARAFASMWLQTLSQTLCAVILLPAALLVSETISLTDAATATLFGFLTGGISDVFFRTGTAFATNPALTAVLYITPVLSLLWIQLAHGINLENPALTATGAGVIIAANVAIHIGRAKPMQS